MSPKMYLLSLVIDPDKVMELKKDVATEASLENLKKNTAWILGG